MEFSGTAEDYQLGQFDIEFCAGCLTAICAGEPKAHARLPSILDKLSAGCVSELCGGERMKSMTYDMHLIVGRLMGYIPTRTQRECRLESLEIHSSTRGMVILPVARNEGKAVLQDSVEL